MLDIYVHPGWVLSQVDASMVSLWPEKGVRVMLRRDPADDEVYYNMPDFTADLHILHSAGRGPDIESALNAAIENIYRNEA